MTAIDSSLLTPTQVGELLGVGERTIRRWANEKRIPSVRVSERIIRFDPAAVEQFIADRTEATS